MDENIPRFDTYTNPFGDLIGLEFQSWSGGKSRCRLDPTPQLMNPNGVLHGAVLYAMADTGMGGALISALGEGRYCTTIEIKIAYFRSVVAGRLTCDAAVVHQGSRIAFLEATVRDEHGPVAHATGTFAVLAAR